MITCPECGELAEDNAKFCNRCGQGLTAAAAAPSVPSTVKPAPLPAGTALKDGFEIVEALPGSSIENRYRARRTREGKTESFIIRERLADQRPEPEPAAEAAQPPAEEPSADPHGPTAKTAELKPPQPAQEAAHEDAGAG